MADQSSGSSTLVVVIATGIFTLAGTLSTPVVTWLSEKRLANKETQKYCLERVDSEQELLRIKGGALLLSIGEFQANVSNPISTGSPSGDMRALLEQAHTITVNAWTLGSVAEPELATAGIELTSKINALFNPSSNPTGKATAQANAAISEWLKLYKKSDETFNRKRSQCLSQSTFDKG